MNTKINHSEPQNHLPIICIQHVQTKLISGTLFETLATIWRKIAPHENPENKPKIEIFLSQLLIIRDIQNLPLDVCFRGWQKKDEIS